MGRGPRRHRAGEGGLTVNCAHCLDPESNHTTAQHEQAMARMCSTCDGPLSGDDEEATRCAECQVEYWEMRRELYYDNLAKDEGGLG